MLEYGSKALEKWEARSMRRDVLFAMALAHLGLASDALEAKEKVSHQPHLCLLNRSQPFLSLQQRALSSVVHKCSCTQ